MNEEERQAFRGAIARIGIGGYYDSQEMRKGMMNRVRDIVRKKEEDIPFDEVEEEKDEEEKSHGKWSDKEVMDKLEEMIDNDELSKEEVKYVEWLIDMVEDTKEREKRYKRFMEHYESEEIYKEFLQHVRGIGTVLSANLIYNIGYCEDYEKVSNLWSHWGLDPQSPKLRNAGKEASYSRDLRKLAYNISDCLIRANSEYKKHFYDPYKKRQLKRMDLKEEGMEDMYNGSAPENKGHAHKRAKRYVVKKFLKHYWVLSREIKDLKVTKPWILQDYGGGHEEKKESPENAHYMLEEVIKG